MSIDLLHENEELLSGELAERSDTESESISGTDAEPTAEPISRFGLLSE